VGQQLVNTFNVWPGLDKIEAAFPGDKDVYRQVTRVRLCLTGEGWRGNVEKMMDYDENGQATTEKKPKKQSVLESGGSTVVSLPPPGADEANLSAVEVSVSVVEVPKGPPGKVNDVSMLSVGGAEDQRRRK
jgi:hypothetical protein